MVWGKCIRGEWGSGCMNEELKLKMQKKSGVRMDVYEEL